MLYSQTKMERWITHEYRNNKMITPDDLNIERLSSIFDIVVWKMEMEPRYDIFNKKSFIVIDSRVSPSIQRAQFFHELCHVLFHVGHQSNMNEPFRQMLEWEAESFVLYAALPYFMIKKYDLTNEYIVHDLVDDFKVTKALCLKRMEQIKNRIQNNISIVAESRLVYNSFK